MWLLQYLIPGVLVIAIAEASPFVKRPSEFEPAAPGSSVISNWRPFSLGGSGGGGTRYPDPAPLPLFAGGPQAPGTLPYVKVHHADRFFPHLKPQYENGDRSLDDDAIEPPSMGNLKNFVSNLKSKLRNEFTALIALADEEEAALGDLGSQHPGMISYAGRKRFFPSLKK